MLIKKILALLALVTALSGCAPTPYWTLTDGANKVAKSKSFEVTIPEGWSRTTVADTRDQIMIDDKERTISLERMMASREHIFKLPISRNNTSL